MRNHIGGAWPPPLSERRRPRREATPFKRDRSSNRGGTYIPFAVRARASRFGASSLDRRFADDVDEMIRRDPRGAAAVLAELGDEFGIRGSLEEAVWRRARFSRRPRLQIIDGGNSS